jgi:AraC-like DNA-binding protein
VTTGSRKENTLSIRMVWPFARVITTHPRAHEYVGQLGISPMDFANPDTRVPHRTVMHMLETLVDKLDMPLLGIRAGELLEPGDFDVVEYAARCTENLGQAMECMARYFRLMHEAAEITLLPEGDLILWRIRVTDSVPQPPAANDFAVASGLAFSRRNAVESELPLELRLMHDRPSYADEYRRFAQKVTYGAPYNGFVFRRERLSVPLAQTNPRMQNAFEMHAKQLLERLKHRAGIAGRVREEVASQLGSGPVSMESTSRRLAMSVATLRRRLEEEGTTFSEIVEELRKHLAEQYLTEPRPAISEIAFLLGFSDVASFDRAFKRWRGVSPRKFRASTQGQSS